MKEQPPYALQCNVAGWLTPSKEDVVNHQKELKGAPFNINEETDSFQRVNNVMGVFRITLAV